MTGPRVVITGLGAVTPAGVGVALLWKALVEGRSTVQVIPELAAGHAKLSWACPVPDFDPKKLIKQRKALKLMCRDIMMSMVASDQASADAGLDTFTMDRERIGLVLGAGLIPAELDEFAPPVQASLDANGRIDMRKFGAEGMGQFFPLWMLKYLPNMLACQVSIAQDIQGVSNTITTGNTSSHQSITEALRIIQRGDADVMLAGAGDCKTYPLVLARLSLLGHLAPEQGDPTRAIRPFDAHAAGYVAAEGAATVVLESLDHARKRGAKIYAEITGSGATCTRTSPHSYQGMATPIADAIDSALKDAHLSPKDISMISATGYAVPDADQSEASAFTKVFGSPCSVPVTAMKSILGNSGAAAGGMELIACALALQENLIPPTPTFETPTATCPLKLSNKPIQQKLTHVLSTAFTLGGQCAAVVLSRYTK